MFRLSAYQRFIETLYQQSPIRLIADHHERYLRLDWQLLDLFRFLPSVLLFLAELDRSLMRGDTPSSARTSVYL